MGNVEKNAEGNEANAANDITELVWAVFRVYTAVGIELEDVCYAVSDACEPYGYKKSDKNVI